MEITLEKQLEYRKKWVEALRGGKYQQAKGRLRDGDKFCCLGLLCNIVAKDLGAKWSANNFDVPGNDDVEFERADKRLPFRVKELVGLRGRLGGYGTSPDRDGNTTNTKYLADANDTGTPFPIIADIIESAPEGLFVEAA